MNGSEKFIHTDGMKYKSYYLLKAYSPVQTNTSEMNRMASNHDTQTSMLYLPKYRYHGAHTKELQRDESMVVAVVCA